MTDRPAPADRSDSKPRLGLSGKLLILTTLFVMMGEGLIYVPSIATFRRNWLNDRLSAAYTAALVLEAAPGAMVPDSLARQILDSIDARAVAMKMGTQRRLLAASDMPPTVDYDIDMRNMSLLREIIDSFGTLVDSGSRTLRVMGPAPMGGEFVALATGARPLRSAMLRYSGTILLL